MGKGQTCEETDRLAAGKDFIAATRLNTQRGRIPFSTLDENRDCVAADAVGSRRLVPVRPRGRGGCEVNVTVAVGCLTGKGRPRYRTEVAVSVVSLHVKGPGLARRHGDRHLRWLHAQEEVDVEGVEGPEEFVRGADFGLAAAGGREVIVICPWCQCPRLRCVTRCGAQAY